MRYSNIALSGLFLLSLSGCSDTTAQKKTPAGPANQVSQVNETAADLGTMEEHPEYGNWKQFGVDTTVRLKKVISNDQETVTVLTQVRLAEKDEKHVAIERQITVDRSLSGKEVNPPFQVDFPAQFRLPSSVKMEQFSLPSLKAKLSGEEDVEVGGLQLKAKKFKWTENNEAGPMEVTYWNSDQMPGRFIRQEQSTGSLNTKSTEEVVEVVIKK